MVNVFFAFDYVLSKIIYLKEIKSRQFDKSLLEYNVV